MAYDATLNNTLQLTGHANKYDFYNQFLKIYIYFLMC